MGDSSGENSCPLCPFISDDANELNNHVNYEHPEQTYLCAACPQKFENIPQLNAHIDDCHMNDSDDDIHEDRETEKGEKSSKVGDKSNKVGEKSRKVGDKSNKEEVMSRKTGNKPRKVILTGNYPHDPPEIDHLVYFEENVVKFSTVLLYADVTTARKNVKDVFEGKATAKWSRRYSVEWINENIEGAKNWSRKELMDRFANAETAGRQFVMTNNQIFSTGAGAMDNLQDPMMRPCPQKEAKKPANKEEKDMMNSVIELDQIRKNLKGYDIHNPKRGLSEADEVKGQSKKAKEFLKSLTNHQDSQTYVEGNNNQSNVRKIKRGSLAGRSAEKVDEADTIRRTAVQNAQRKTRERAGKDEDEKLSETPKGVDDVMSLVARSLQKDFDNGDKNEKKIKNLSDNQEKMANAVSQNSRRLGEIENTQKDQSQALEEIKESQRKSDERQEKMDQKQNKMYNMIARLVGEKTTEEDSSQTKPN